MTDRQKPKTNRTVNDARKNGKKWKSGDGGRSSGTPQNELQKALMGGGALVRVMRPIPENYWAEKGRVEG